MLDLFTPQVPLGRCHPNFLAFIVGRPQSHRDELLAWSEGFVDRDGKFVIEFQTTFNAAFWELYVFASLKKMGYAVDFSYPAPDFVVLRDGTPSFCIEATVASNANDATPEWRRDWRKGKEVDLMQIVDDATIRFANSITAKYEKYRTSYSTIPVIGKLPFVLAVAPFDQPWFFKESVYPPLRVLYGIDPRYWPKKQPPRPMPSIKKTNGADVPLGYFLEPIMPEISAVMFSNVATATKVAALAKDDPNYQSYFVWVQRMDGKGDRAMKERIPKAEYKEELLDGLHLFHNPKAHYHFPKEYFDFEGTAQWGCNIATRTPFRTGTPDILLQRASVLTRKKQKRSAKVGSREAPQEEHSEERISRARHGILQMIATCKLCLRPRQRLQKSHYMPAALYPKNLKLEYLSVGGVRSLVAGNEIKMPLLCFDCEQRFSRRGESEVLRHVAPKIAKKPIPLIARLHPLVVKEEDLTLKSYSGSEAKLNMDMFAYFALSMAWRATHSWPVKGESDTKPLSLGLYKEPIRQFLAEETNEFPRDTGVIVIVCTDKLSREAWFLPTQCDDVWYHDLRVLTYGVMFRVVLGRSIPEVLRSDSCHAEGKRIHMGDVSKKTTEALDSMQRT